jgi:quercetin dioxygenase-like cupin family protein
MNFDDLDSAMGGESEAEKLEFRELSASLGLALPLDRPSENLKSRLMKLVNEQPAEPLPGIFVRRAGESGWTPTRFEGVTYKTLYIDRALDLHTLLLRFEPGGRYPRHRHAKVEQCLVLSGEVSVDGQVSLNAGDFEWARAEIYSANGCELLIIASLHDEVLA